MAGTGLPFPKTGDVLTQAPNVIDADRYSSARAWGQIAAAAGDVAKAGGDYLEYQQKQREVGYLAEREETIRRRALDLSAEHRDDSRAFDAAWKGFSEGVIAEAEPKAIPHLKRALGTHGNTAYGGILQREMVRAERLDIEQVQVNIDSTGRDVMAAATAGTLYGPDGTFTPGGQIKIAEFRNKLNAAVNVKLMSPEKADFIYNDFLSKAQDEDTARRALDLYKAEGFEAAEGYLRKNILENETLSLKPEERRRAYSYGLQQLQKQRMFDRQDRGDVEAGARDLKARIESGQPYDDTEVRDMRDDLARVGSMNRRRDLVLSDAVRKETRGAGLPELATAARGARSVAEVINSAAAESGVDRDLLMRIARIESSFNPNAVTGSYKGLFQLSEAEFARYGGKNIMDQAENARVGALKLRDEITAFRQSYGRDPTPTEIYLTHQQGAGGLKAHLSNPAAPAWENMLSTGEGRQKGEAWAKAAIWGNVPDNLKAQFGSVENITSAQFVELWRGKVEGGAAGQDAAALAPYQGEFAKRIQQVLIRDARTAWPAMKDRIDRGRPLDGPDFEAVREAAALSGDRKWHEEVEAETFASRFGRRIESVPPNERQAMLDQLRAELPATGLPTNMQDQIDKSVTQQVERRNKQVREDPVGYAIERGFGPPAALDFSSPVSARAGISDRVLIAKGVAEEERVPVGNPFRPAERAQMAGSIANGDVRQAAVTMNALADLPDEILTPVLSSPDIKSAIVGAARSADPARFNAAMMFMDRVWARAPETATHLFGGDVVDDLKMWQTNLRYMTPEQLAEQRKRESNDPQLRERRKQLEGDGLREARKHSFDDIVSQFNTSWWVTPSIVARNITSADPQPPVPTGMLPPGAADVRDAFMGDFETQYARFYARGMSKDDAMKSAAEVMKTKWTASPTNGGRLMLNAPETIRGANGNAIYPSVGGSYDWMKKQLEADIATQVGKPMFGPQPGGVTQAALAAAQLPLAGRPQLSERNWSYVLISDRQTQAEAQQGLPASYLVMVTDAQTGKSTILPKRQNFDASGEKVKAEEAFQQRFDFERRRNEAAQPSQVPFRLRAM
jgi:hypothetical protein